MWFIGRNFGTSEIGHACETSHTSVAVLQVSGTQPPSNQPAVVSCGCGDPSESSSPEITIGMEGRLRVPGQWDRDLMAFYPLGESGGDDISGRGNHANAAIAPAELVPGRICQFAERMDGRQSFALPFDLHESATVSLWIKPTASRLESTVLSIGADIRIGLSFLLEPIISINRDRETEVNVTAPRLTPAIWYHLAFVYDCTGHASIFVDGKAIPIRQDGAVTDDPIVPNVEPRFRSQPYLSRYLRREDPAGTQRSGLTGVVQDVLIRSCAMTAGEVHAEYAGYCEPQFQEVTA